MRDFIFNLTRLSTSDTGRWTIISLGTVSCFPPVFVWGAAGLEEEDALNVTLFTLEEERLGGVHIIVPILLVISYPF